MELIVNGKPMEAPEGATVADLVERLGLGLRTVVVERNGEPVARSRFGEEALAGGDVIEVVRAVAGGSPVSLEDARLYLVTDGALPLDVLEGTINAGVGIVQLREKEAEAVPLIETGEEFMGVCRSDGVPFIVNDRPDVALALRADGVHLGQDDLPPRVAREVLPEGIIGRSTHSSEQIDQALRDRDEGCVDYIAVGPVHATPTKPGRPPVGLDLVRYAAEHVGFPWYAIGGIGPDNVGEVVASGARRIVVVRAITQASDPIGVAARLREALG